MTVSEIMTTDVITVAPDTKITEIAEILHSRQICGVPVINELGIVEGLITQRELFSQDYKFYFPMYAYLVKHTDFVLGGKDLPYAAEKITRITAREVMNKQVYFARADMTPEILAAKAGQLGLESIPVTDSGNKLLGIITKGDLLRYFTGVGSDELLNLKAKHIDEEVNYVATDLSSRFAYVAKARVNIWVTVATVLFIIGFIAGMVYVANPNIIGWDKIGNALLKTSK